MCITHLFSPVNKDIRLGIEQQQGCLRLELWEEKQKSAGFHLILNVMQAKQLAESVIAVVGQMKLADVSMPMSTGNGNLTVDFAVGQADAGQSKMGQLSQTRKGDVADGSFV